jgi:hypothetical protein
MDATVGNARGTIGVRDRRTSVWSTACSMALVVVSTATAQAAERRVVVDRDGRVGVRAAAATLAVSEAAISVRYAATGVVECGGMRGIGQITGRGDVVTSAAHVFFDESGRSRAESGRCLFRAASGEEIVLTPDAARCGSSRPYEASGRHDWAVARLAHPLDGVRPYRLGGTPRVGQEITVVGYERGAPSWDFCRVRDVLAGAGGGVEIRTDCVGLDGLSGAAYLTREARPALLGVHVGFRSRHPDTAGAYGEDHHTFGAAIGGAFGQAVTAAR